MIFLAGNGQITSFDQVRRHRAVRALCSACIVLGVLRLWLCGGAAWESALGRRDHRHMGRLAPGTECMLECPCTRTVSGRRVLPCLQAEAIEELVLFPLHDGLQEQYLLAVAPKAFAVVHPDTGQACAHGTRHTAHRVACACMRPGGGRGVPSAAELEMAGRQRSGSACRGGAPPDAALPAD